MSLQLDKSRYNEKGCRYNEKNLIITSKDVVIKRKILVKAATVVRFQKSCIYFLFTNYSLFPASASTRWIRNGSARGGSPTSFSASSQFACPFPSSVMVESCRVSID